MVDDEPKAKKWLSKPKFSKKYFTKRARKVEGATIRHAHKFIIKRWINVREVQQHVIFWVLAIGFLIAASGLQLMWYQSSYQTIAPANKGTYAEAVLGPIDTLNPLFAKTSAEQSASYLMFSRLMNYDRTGHLNYDIATDVKINDTKKVYTVSIRPDVKWHDGAKLTTQDIEFTINLMKNPNVRTVDYGWGGITTKVINDTTIEFTLPATYGAFEHFLTFPIVPKHKLGNVASISIRENIFSQKPVGSGPFKINFIQNSEGKSGHKIIHMQVNPDYYGGTPKLSSFQLHIYSTTDQIIEALSKSEVNAAAGILSADISRVDTKRYTVSSEPIQSGVYALINMKSPLLQDLNLRQALRSATNKNAIREKLPAKTPNLDLPFTQNQLIGDVPKAPVFNQAVANKLLDEGGWKMNSKNVRVKDGKQLKISVVTIKNSEFESVLETLAGQWRSVGFSIDTKVIDPSDITQNVVQSILQPRNFDVLLYQLNIGADPDVYAYWHSSQVSPGGLNYSNYSNAISDDALISARSRIEPELRNAKYITFAKQWLSDIPAIGLYQSTTEYVSGRTINSFDITNYLVSPVDRYSDILNWSVGERGVYKTP